MAAAIRKRSRQERNRRVDQVHESADGTVLIVVDGGDWRMDINVKLIEHVARDVEQCEGGNITQRSCGIPRPERIHGDLLIRDGEAIRDTLRKELEDLVCRILRLDNEGEVEAKGETNLNQGRVRRSRGHSTWRLNNPGHVRRQASGGRRAGGHS